MLDLEVQYMYYNVIVSNILISVIYTTMVEYRALRKK